MTNTIKNVIIIIENNKRGKKPWELSAKVHKKIKKMKGMVVIMANTKKPTKRVLIGKILEVQEIKENQELVDFLNHELELLDRKVQGNRERAKVESEDRKVIKDLLLDVLMELGKPVSITEMQKANSQLAEYSNQKLSAMLKIMVENDGTVVKDKDKKKTVFSIAEMAD